MRIKYSLRDRRLTPARLAVLGALAVAAACNSDKLLEVTDPDVARRKHFRPRTAQRAGAVSNLASPNGGARIEQVHLSALLADEFINTETFPTRIEIDQRAMTWPPHQPHRRFRSDARARSFADLAIDNYRLGAKTAADGAVSRKCCR